MDGVQTTQEVISKYPAVKIVGISIHSDGFMIQRMFDAGAVAYLTKDIYPDIFNNAIKSVLNGEKYVTPQAAVSYTLHKVNGENYLPPLQVFSEQELNIIRLIAGGLSDKEIGNDLDISVRTVHAHKRNITDKLGKQKVTEIVAFAFKSGLMKR